MLLLTVAVAASSVAAGAQELSVDMIFGSQQLAPEALPEMTWTPDGQKMTFVASVAGTTTDLVALNLETGQQQRIIDGSALIPPGELNPVPIEGYQWSPDGRSLLIYTRSERVWRDNTRGVYFVYSLDDGTLRPISTGFGYQMFAKFSPAGDQVGFVRDRNVFVTDLVSGMETQLTHDGGEEIINGTFDWVYEEELGLQDGWRWSPDGRSIAFWRLDQTPIKDFYLIDDLGLYSRPIPIPYPKAGEPNSFAHIGVVDVTSGETRWMDFGENPDQYLARMEWARTSDELIVQRLNRLQNRLDVMLADRATGASRVLFSESSDTWVDVDDDLRWVDDERFLWTSDRDGYDHLYLYDRQGRLVRQLTSGEFDVESPAGVDLDGRWVYYTAASEGPLGRQAFRVSLDGGAPARLTNDPGTHSLDVSPTGRFFVDTHTRAGDPAVITVHRGDGGPVGTLVDNAAMRSQLADLGLAAPEFFSFTTSDGVDLNGWMIKPPDFDESRRYPVLMYVYGGPGSQTVSDDWGGNRYLWHQLLAQKGVLVVSVDGRGTGARGRDFRTVTYQNLGDWETHDQIEAARYLGALPFVDESRIAVWGWSYGGYMTLLSLMKGGDLFRAGISVAPVTSWKLYDTIYTERFMRTPRENPEGYRSGSPLTHVDGMTGELLLVHGTGDDNVHFQNSVQMLTALQDAGKQFSFMAYPNKTHSISGEATQVHLYTMMTEWILERLSLDGTPVT